jgi:hypothetical protein
MIAHITISRWRIGEIRRHETGRHGPASITQASIT